MDKNALIALIQANQALVNQTIVTAGKIKAVDDNAIRTNLNNAILAIIDAIFQLSGVVAKTITVTGNTSGADPDLEGVVIDDLLAFQGGLEGVNTNLVQSIAADGSITFSQSFPFAVDIHIYAVNRTS